MPYTWSVDVQDQIERYQKLAMRLSALAPEGMLTCRFLHPGQLGERLSADWKRRVPQPWVFVLSISSFFPRRKRRRLQVLATARTHAARDCSGCVVPWQYPARLSVSASPSRTSRPTRREPRLVRVEAALGGLWWPWIGASGAPNDNQGRRGASGFSPSAGDKCSLSIKMDGLDSPGG